LSLSLEYILTPDSVTESTLDTLFTIKCNGDVLLSPIIEDDHAGGAFPALLAIDMFLMVVFIGCAIFFCIKVPGHVSKSKVHFTFLIIFGSFLCYFSGIFWYLVPDQDYVCQLRQWLTAMGITFLMTSIVSRNWALLQVYLKRKKFITYGKGVRDVNIILTIITLLQIALLICWSSIDHLSASLRTINDLDLVYAWECDCDNWGLWMGLEIALVAVLLLFLLVTMYVAWKFSASILAHKYIVMSIYNLIMIFAIVIIVYVTVIDDDYGFALCALVTMAVTATSTLFLNFHMATHKSGLLTGSTTTGGSVGGGSIADSH
jgi:hypothetical protein